MNPFDCPHCGQPIGRFPFPLLTVDCIVRDEAGRVLLIERRFPPPGWALPGGFVDRGETVEQAVRREILEETGMQIEDLAQFHVYSDPARDKRHHVVSVIFTGLGRGRPLAGDDAGQARFFPLADLPHPMAFDHAEVLAAYALREPLGR